MSNSLQIPRAIAVLSDRVNIHLRNFERSHPDEFSYELVKEAFRIQRFHLIFERRPYHGWDYYRDKQDLGSIRLSPLGSSLTELVMEDSSSLNVDSEDLYYSVFNPLNRLDSEPNEPEMTRDGATQAAKARFEFFRAIHQEVRDQVIDGLKDDGILLGKPQIAELKSEMSPYVSKSRIAELRQIRSTDFDLRRLIRLCEELNKCFGTNSFCATAALLRAVIDHVPPIFEVETFAEVANNIGGQSNKKSLLRLQTACRDISDAMLHQRIRSREVLPTAIQVDFKNELDVLLGEIVRKLG
jgi:hypothetical protein